MTGRDGRRARHLEMRAVPEGHAVDAPDQAERRGRDAQRDNPGAQPRAPAFAIRGPRRQRGHSQQEPDARHVQRAFGEHDARGHDVAHGQQRHRAPREPERRFRRAPAHTPRHQRRTDDDHDPQRLREPERHRKRKRVAGKVRLQPQRDREQPQPLRHHLQHRVQPAAEAEAAELRHRLDVETVAGERGVPRQDPCGRHGAERDQPGSKHADSR